MTINDIVCVAMMLFGIIIIASSIAIIKFDEFKQRIYDKAYSKGFDVGYDVGYVAARCDIENTKTAIERAQKKEEKK